MSWLARQHRPTKDIYTTKTSILMSYFDPIMAKQSQPESAVVKTKLHARNLHRSNYDFDKLISTHDELKKFVKNNKYGNLSIDFSDPNAVKSLNTALLKSFYNINFWDIPSGYLCPPIPGRVDYLHYAADLLAESNNGQIPKGPLIRCMDIGVGANCIYPIIGNSIYGWRFTGTEIDEIAINAAKANVENNTELKNNVDFKLQLNSKDIYYGTVRRDDKFELSICNPPFHSSLEEAQAGSARKVRNLTGKKVDKPTLNFGGQNQELWCEGGEKRFILNMIRQSSKFKDNFLWFSTLVSKQSHLGQLQASLNQYAPVETKVIEMGQGNKVSRILAWTFHNKEQQFNWMKNKDLS